VYSAGASLDTLNALDTAIVYVRQILEHRGASSSADAPVVPLSASSYYLPELLRQAEAKLLNLRCEVRAMLQAAAVDQLEEGLVQFSVAESSAYIIPEHQPSSINHQAAAVRNVVDGSCFSRKREHLRRVFGISEGLIVASVQARGHVCRVHKGGVVIKLSAAVSRV
jgi:hypothetical protein